MKDQNICPEISGQLTTKIHSYLIKSDKSHKQPDICFSQCVATNITLLA